MTHILYFTLFFLPFNQLDDMEDAEMISLLVEDCPPVPLVAVTTQVPPGMPRESIVTNLQMFTRVWRTKVPTILNHNVFNQYFDKLLQVIFFLKFHRDLIIEKKSFNLYRLYSRIIITLSKLECYTKSVMLFHFFFI